MSHEIHRHVFDFPGCVCVTVFEACVCARVHVESFVQRCWCAVRGRAVNAVTLLQASLEGRKELKVHFFFSRSWKWLVNCSNLKTTILNLTSTQRPPLSCYREIMENGFVGMATQIKVWLFMLSRRSNFSGTPFVKCILGFVVVFIFSVLLCYF